MRSNQENAIHVVVFVFQGIVDEVQAFRKESDAIKNWERYTGISWSEYQQDSALLHVDYSGSSIIPLIFHTCPPKVLYVTIMIHQGVLNAIKMHRVKWRAVRDWERFTSVRWKAFQNDWDLLTKDYQGSDIFTCTIPNKKDESSKPKV